MKIAPFLEAARAADCRGVWDGQSLRQIVSLSEFFRKIRTTELSRGIHESSCVALAMFGAAHVWIFPCNLIRGAIHASLVGGACILIALFDVVVFAAEVFHAVVVDVYDCVGACGRNFIPAQVAYVIDERGCLGGRAAILALRRLVSIEGDHVFILARRTK